MVDLESIYRETLGRCRPDHLIRGVVPPDAPTNVVAIGKCAGALLDGFASVRPVENALAIVPRGYPPPRHTRNTTTVWGGHPHVNGRSFEAGERLVRFVDRHEEIAFLISGGGSACVEKPLEPWFIRDDLIEANARLLAAGIPIAEINTVRKH